MTKKIRAIGLGKPIIEDMTAEELALKDAEKKAWEDGVFDRSLNGLREKRIVYLQKLIGLQVVI